MSYKAHFFICTHGPEKEGRCGHKNSEALKANLKEATRQLGLKGVVRINASGCLGHCEKGISCVMYPQNQWYFEKKPENAPELLQEIVTALNDIKAT